MNINKLFKRQAELDKHIVEEKGLQGQDLLKRKTVSLICELYECVNEARFFKFWSSNQRPNIEQWVDCEVCDGTGDLNYEMVQEEAESNGGHEYIDCEECGSSGMSHMINPLLEEYADTLHFALSIANDLGYHSHEYVELPDEDLNVLTLGLTNLITLLPESRSTRQVSLLLNYLIKLGYQLGFTEKEVISAYYDKNKVNHARQENGY